MTDERKLGRRKNLSCSQYCRRRSHDRAHDWDPLTHGEIDDLRMLTSFWFSFGLYTFQKTVSGVILCVCLIKQRKQCKHTQKCACCVWPHWGWFYFKVDLSVSVWRRLHWHQHRSKHDHFGPCLLGVPSGLRSYHNGDVVQSTAWVRVFFTSLSWKPKPPV